MSEIDKILFFDHVNEVPNFKGVKDWTNQTRIANLMAYTQDQDIFYVGCYKFSIG